MPITIFSKSVSGYNKREVDEYIADLNRASVKMKRDYEKKIEVLEAEVSKLRRELEDAQNTETAPVPSPDDIQAETALSTHDDAVAEKSRRYDEISRQVGEILMDANAEASVIVRRADEKVRATLTGTISTLRGEMTSLIEKLGELLKSAEAVLTVEEDADGDGTDA